MAVEPQSPTGERDAFATWLPIAWTAFRLSVWVMVVFALFPRLLRVVGADDLYRWIGAHGWFRWVLLLVLGPLFLIAAFDLRGVRRVQPGDGDGPEWDVNPDGFDLQLGLREGDPVRWSAGSHSIEAATWARRSERRLVATAILREVPGFGFSARSARLEPGWMRAMSQQAMKAGLEQTRRRVPAAAAGTVDAMRFLTDDPIDLRGTPIGPDVVLRSDRPDLARALFSDSDAIRALEWLDNAGRRWEVSLLPGTPGTSLLRFEAPGRLQHAELADAARVLMNALLVRLDAELDRTGGATLPRASGE